MKIKEKKPFVSQRVFYLPVDSLRPNPNQPRRYFEEDALRELSESILRYGILQPLTVRRGESGYELIAGERCSRSSRIFSAATCITLRRLPPLPGSLPPMGFRRSRRRNGWGGRSLPWPISSGCCACRRSAR